MPKFYVNGELVITSGSTTISNINKNIAPLHIGKSPLPEYLDLDGYLDEIRLSNSSRSHDWIQTEYKNQHDPTSLISLGEEETQPHTPIIFNPFPIDSVIVTGEHTELNFSLMDYQGDLMNFTVSTNPDIGKASFEYVGNGNYSIPVSGLEYYKTYEWRVEVTDGVNTESKVFSFTPSRPGDDIIPPRADAGIDMIVDEDKSIQFDGSNSKDNIGVSDYTWTFLDERSQMLTGVNPTYTFSMPGTYQVLLVVTDFAGNQDTDFFLVIVKDVTNPDARIQIDVETFFVGNTITFDGGNSIDNVNVTNFKWNLGDGTIVNEKKIIHRYSETGVYNVTLTVQDARGNIDVDWIEVTVVTSWGSDIYLLIIFIVFILAVIYSVYHIYSSSPKSRQEIFRIE
jgi:PKD repeat protein